MNFRGGLAPLALLKTRGSPRKQAAEHAGHSLGDTVGRGGVCGSRKLSARLLKANTLYITKQHNSIAHTYSFQHTHNTHTLFSQRNPIALATKARTSSRTLQPQRTNQSNHTASATMQVQMKRAAGMSTRSAAPRAVRRSSVVVRADAADKGAVAKVRRRVVCCMDTHDCCGVAYARRELSACGVNSRGPHNR